MSFWVVFWFITILFTLISFFYMSSKVLYNGIHELKYMFKTLEDEEINNNNKEK